VQTVSDQETFDPADFPRLREFARGYLHQDVLREYGSAEAAARAYLADLNEDEQKEIAAEAKRLIDRAQQRTLKDGNEKLTALGAAWRAKTIDQFESLTGALINRTSG
jgi:hypothetical protein